jgi:hypothetical protein
VIPYWKTETIEAMGAFRYKDNFTTGAGECVSLSALYAAAMFVVGRIPLEKIFLIATPLHSQNFIIEKDGLITNNRRIVTKNMWFNGTSLSEKARRAMENEKVSIVSHISGYIHSLYDEATIDRVAYENFSVKLKEFLVTDLTKLIFINFLRFKSRYKSLFQYMCDCSGRQRYISLEKMFEYEHNSKFNVSAENRGSLVREIEGDEFHLSPIHGKMLLNNFEDILDNHSGKTLNEIENEFIKISGPENEEIIHEMCLELKEFICIDPSIPVFNKEYVSTPALKISTDDSRDKIISHINKLSEKSELALLALYAFRQMDKTDWRPFVKAAIERNPVCFADLEGKSPSEVTDILNSFPDESIYEGKRLALPDEVWNFKRGDGIEKALLLADFIMHNNIASEVKIEIGKGKVQIKCNGYTYNFISYKNLSKSILISKGKYIIQDKLSTIF